MEFKVNEKEKQFELHLENGSVAFVEYSSDGDKIYLTHTEVPDSMRQQGVGSDLIKRTLGYIKAQNKTLVPLCSFVSKYVNNHDEWHSLLSEGYQM